MPGTRTTWTVASGYALSENHTTAVCQCNGAWSRPTPCCKWSQCTHKNCKLTHKGAQFQMYAFMKVLCTVVHVVFTFNIRDQILMLNWQTHHMAGKQGEYKIWWICLKPLLGVLKFS